MFAQLCSNSKPMQAGTGKEESYPEMYCFQQTQRSYLQEGLASKTGDSIFESIGTVFHLLQE